MFEHLRTDLTAQLARAQDAVKRAVVARDQAQQQLDARIADLPARAAALASAQAGAQSAAAALAAAQAVVTQRSDACDAAQRGVEAAETKLDDLAGKEPDEELPNGKPNPAHAAWVRAVQQAQIRASSASTTLAAANQALAQAASGRDTAAAAAGAAANAVSAAQAQLVAANAAVTAAQQRLAAESATIVEDQHAADAIDAEIGGLNARAARLLAEPLDRGDLEAAADAELAGLLAARRHRHELWTTRAQQRAVRASVLAAQDATVDDAHTVRDAIASWPDAPRYPALANVTSALDSVIIASAAQRSTPPASRTDDLALAADVLSAQVAAVQAVAQQAAAERDAASTQLAQAAAALAQHQRRAP